MSEIIKRNSTVLTGFVNRIDVAFTIPAIITYRTCQPINLTVVFYVF